MRKLGSVLCNGERLFSGRRVFFAIRRRGEGLKNTYGYTIHGSLAVERLR